MYIFDISLQSPTLIEGMNLYDCSLKQVFIDLTESNQNNIIPDGLYLFPRAFKSITFDRKRIIDKAPSRSKCFKSYTKDKKSNSLGYIFSRLFRVFLFPISSITIQLLSYL